MKDYKNYEAQDGAMTIKALTWLLVAIFFAAIAYTSTQQYEECMAGNKSVAMCGGGNVR